MPLVCMSLAEICWVWDHFLEWLLSHVRISLLYRNMYNKIIKIGCHLFTFERIFQFDWLTGNCRRAHPPLQKYRSSLIRQLNERMLKKDREVQEVRSNNQLRTVLPEGLSGILSKEIRWRCAHAPFNPVTISDQNIRFPIPCPTERDVKE